MNENEYLEKKRNRTATLIQVFLGIHEISMFTASVYMNWSVIGSAIIMASFVLGWTVYFSKYRDYWFRAMMETFLVELCLVIYSIQAENYLVIWPMFLAVAIMVALYNIKDVLYEVFIAATIFYLVRWFGMGEIFTYDKVELFYAIMQFLNVYFIIFVEFIWIISKDNDHQKLINSITRLDKAEKIKDDFLANISHEIRTPVNTICGMSELALNEKDIKVIKEKLNDIKVAGRALTNVVGNVLDFSELQSGKIEIVEEEYNITSTINDVICIADAKRGNKHLEMIVNCDGDIPSGLYGDEKKIRRIIMCLVDNAIKFTDEGGISVNISARKESYGVNLNITVRDTGIGINEDDLEKLFEEFSMGETDRNRARGGMGLGLPITRILLDKMGGVLTARSVPGKGSVFKVVIPQKVVNEAPIVQLDNPEKVNSAFYVDFEYFEMRDVRDEYMKLVENVSKSLKINNHMCRNLNELKRRFERESFSHVFIGFQEYSKNKEYFNGLAERTKLIVILEKSADKHITTNKIIRLYKPFSIHTVANALNGTHSAEAANPVVSGKFEAPNLKVLVVDDNAMNIRVIKGLLEKYKIKVESAESGQAALKKVESMDYDFVLMDHMMPGMDGIETFHAIRNKGKLYYRRLPVIALTANAVAGTREMFIAEGFADYLEKPVEPSVLERTLLRNIPKEKIKYDVEQPSDFEPVDFDKVETEEKEFGDLDVEKGFLYCGGKEKFVEILELTVNDYQSRKNDLESYFAAMDFKNYTILVHALKSSMFSIGAVPLSNLAKELEKAGKEDNSDYIIENHEALMQEYERVIRMIKRSLGTGSSVATKAEETVKLTPEELNMAVGEFENAAFSLDVDGMNKVLDELEQKAVNISAIRRKVDMSDYFSALEALRTLK